MTPRLEEFVLEELPRPPARVLEVGCGEGELARALDAAGFGVLAIDPRAPDGRIFERTTIEALPEDEGPFEAVVASRSLHHVDDLEVVLAKIARLAPLLVVEEFAWDLFDPGTARWYDEQRHRSPDPPPPASEWKPRHAHLHGFDALREAFRRHFVERSFAFVPYLHRYLHVPELEPVEAELIGAGKLQALAFRFVGVPAGLQQPPVSLKPT